MKLEQQNSYRYESIEFNIASHVYYEFSRDPGSYVAMHWHDAIELISILEGTLTVETEFQRYDLKAGDCLLLDANILHSTATLTGNTAILLQIPTKDLDDFIPDVKSRRFFWDPFTRDPVVREQIGTVRSLLNRMRENEETRPSCWALRSASLLLELIFQLYSNFSAPVSTGSFHQSAKNRERLLQVISYTKEHYREPITLEDAAAQLHLQVNHFCHFFKKNVGITYMQYLSEYRLSQIYRDLIVTDIPLSRLLEIHGFTNYKLFRVMFKERFHMTPSAFRKSQRTAK